MKGDSDTAYRNKTSTLREEFETAAHNLAVEKGEIDAAKSEKAAINQDIEVLELKRSALQQDVEDIEEQKSDAIESHKILLEEHGRAESEALAKADEAQKILESKTAAIADLDQKKNERDAAITDRDAAYKDRDAAKEEASQIRADAQSILAEAESRAQGLEQRESDAAAMKDAAGKQSTQNEVRAGQIHGWALKIQKLANDTGFLGENGQTLDVFKELGIIRDSV